MSTNSKVSHPYVGMWVTRDDYIRHELLADGRYDEARGTKKSAYQGRYKVTENHIDYVDDTGFTADGDFLEGVLYLTQAWCCTAKPVLGRARPELRQRKVRTNVVTDDRQPSRAVHRR